MTYTNDTEKELLRTAAENVNAVSGNSQGAEYLDQVSWLASEIGDRDRLMDLADDLRFLASDLDSVSVEAVVDSAMA